MAHPVRTQQAAGELAFTIRIFVSPRTAKPQFSVFQKQLWFCFYLNKTMLEIENPFGVVAMLTARKTGREVHPEALTDFGESVTSRKPSNMFAR